MNSIGGTTLKISVVSPVYNCADSLVELHRQLVEALTRLPGVSDYEMILVDDGSADDSWDVIGKIATNDLSVKAVRLSRNFGQHHALTAGLDIGDGDWFLTLDADLQDSPLDIELLWRRAQEGFDLVHGQRTLRTDPVWRRVGARLFHMFFEWLAGLEYERRVANFRLMSREVVESLRSMPERSRNIGAQLQWLGFRTAYVGVRQHERVGRRSSYTLRKLIRLAFDTAIAYSNKPLRLSVASGLAISGVAIIFSVVIAVRAVVWGIPVEGWASLMVSMWFLGGAIIASVGVVGIYVGRVFDESKGRPIYVVSETINC